MVISFVVQNNLTSELSANKLITKYKYYASSMYDFFDT